MAGNVVYGQSGGGRFGILLGGGSIDALDNVVFGNYHGIGGAGTYLIAENRVYDQTGIGIWMDGSTVQQNVVYSNAIGIRAGTRAMALVGPSRIT